MFLVDTNIWLERLLDQEHAAEVGDFLSRIPSEWFFRTDFTLHSIGIVLGRFDQLEALSWFVRDIFVDSVVMLIHVYPNDMEAILHAIKELHLDFDDAYRYVAAEKFNLTLASFDSDFDHTPRRKKTPGEVIQRQSGWMIGSPLFSLSLPHSRVTNWWRRREISCEPTCASGAMVPPQSKWTMT